MFPPLSLLAGKYMANLEETGHISKLFLYTHLFFSLITAGAIACAPVSPDAGNWVQWCISAAMLAAGLIAAYFFKKGRFLICQGLIVSGFVFSVWFIFGAPVTRLFTSESIAIELKKNWPENGSVYIDAFYRPSVAFYGDIYGKVLPKFDKEDFGESIKNREKGILLPTDSMDKDIEKGAYILVQEKVYNRWPKTKKAGFQLIWKKDTALFLQKES